VIVAAGNPLHPLEDVLRHILNWLHTSVGLPWAWAVILLTVMVRILLVPLVIKQIHSMQSLQRHAPEMKAIQQKYKNDKQRQQEELMKFYKENNVNPAASCLPILLQMPVFFALYFVLRHFSNHPPCPGHPGKLATYCVRHGDFSWLGVVPNIAKGATTHWTGYVLLVIYVASQMASTYYMGTTMDKSQRYILLIMPIAFVFFIAHFPTGLVLYWMTTNLWVVGQGLITRRLIPKTAAPPGFGGTGFGGRPGRKSPRGDGGAGDGAAKKPDVPKPSPAAAAQPRRVKRKKQTRRR
jgi:YidC/Oxa1 family membrane protein insertase